MSAGKGKKRDRNLEGQAIKDAIASVIDAQKNMERLLEEWRTENPTCYAVVEYNQGYKDRWTKSYHCTQEEAEKAKPADITTGWEPCTYNVVQVETSKLPLDTLQRMFVNIYL